LHLYLEQWAQLGTANIPTSLIHNIRQARDEIKRCKSILRAWNVPIKDMPDDEEQTASPILSTQESSTSPRSETRPREINRHLFLAYCTVDEEFSKNLELQLNRSGRHVILSERALFAGTSIDFQDVEDDVRRCHIAAVVFSDASLNQLEELPIEQRIRTKQILEIMRTRTRSALALCMGKSSLVRVV
jgi:hypothetical protein